MTSTTRPFQRSRIAPTAFLAAACALSVAACGGETVGTITRTSAAARAVPVAHVVSESAGPFPVGERTFTFVDPTRTIRLAHHKRIPRTLVTIIRYPAARGRLGRDLIGAAPAQGVFPLIVFGHGFAVTPAPYARLLRAWAAAGYVVAAPIFPLENADAPGGPDENDLVNQPRDMSFVISSVLTSSLTTIVDGQRIAVAGQSDGGETAFAVAYDRPFVDHRIDAAVILSGAQLPGAGFAFSSPSPPLLASQGTADVVNLPMYTYQFFHKAPRPKYLLQLLGAPHLPPYTYEQPQLGIVERVTIAFLDRYLRHSRAAAARMVAFGNVPGTARLTADP